MLDGRYQVDTKATQTKREKICDVHMEEKSKPSAWKSTPNRKQCAINMPH